VVDVGRLLAEQIPNSTETNELKPKQRALIPYLLSFSIDEACRQSGRSKSTAHKWLKEPAFKAALKQAQDEAFADGITRIKGNVTKAVDVLVELLRAEDNQIRIRAAENIIEYAVKLNHNEELERRIIEMEERMKEKWSWPSH
jgi:hypothetical protein